MIIYMQMSMVKLTRQLRWDSYTDYLAFKGTIFSFVVIFIFFYKKIKKNSQKT